MATTNNDNQQQLRILLLNNEDKFSVEKNLTSSTSSNSRFAQQREALRARRGEASIEIKFDEQQRITERDPRLCLQFVMLKEWAMMHLLDVYSIDNYFGN